MRAFITSVITLAILIGVWTIFFQYSNHSLHRLIHDIKNQIMPAIEQENWDTAYELFDEQYQQWHTYEKNARYMLETDLLNQIDEDYARTLMYIKAKDLSNSSGELLALQETLKALQKNESLILSNVF